MIILELEQNGAYFTNYFGAEVTPLITLTRAFVNSFTHRNVINGIRVDSYYQHT